jgi:hypothetical protein
MERADVRKSKRKFPPKQKQLRAMRKRPHPVGSDALQKIAQLKIKEQQRNE